jgi:hypothetical protein
MGRYQVSIASFMAVIIVFALAFTAIHAATQLWVNIVYNLVVVGLLVATYKSISTRGIAAARWAGCAAFGWAHLVLGGGLPWGQHFGVSLGLFTDEAIWRIVLLLEPDNTPDMAQRRETMYPIVHCIVSLLFGVLGAGIFGFFAARRIASEGDHRPTG